MENWQDSCAWHDKLNTKPEWMIHMTGFAAPLLLFVVSTLLWVVVSTYLAVSMMIYSTGHPMIGLAIALLLTVVFTFLSGWMAGQRGRSLKLWFWLGAILGPIAILAIALLPPVPATPAGQPR
jgi:MFS family permease